MSVIAVVLMTSSAYATNGMRMIGLGPVQDSMGGVSVGVPLDAASVLTNPAGMSFLPGRIDFGASYFKPSVKYKATGAGPGVVINNDVSIDSDRGGSPVPAFGLIIPINDSLRFGIGAYGVAGMGVDYKSNLYSGVTYTSYSQMRFAPGLSYKINDIISVGAAVNIMYGTMEFNAGGPTQQPHMGASSFGYGATFGVLVKPVDFLQIGLAYETKSFFEDYKFNTATGEEKLEFNQPQSATIGFGIKPIKDLVIGFDVQWIDWSQTVGGNLPEYKARTGMTMPWNMDWSDQVVYKVGIQYAVHPMVTLRAGYNYGKMPLNSDRAFENMAFPAVSEHHFTAGLGLNLTKNMTLNIGGMYSPPAKISGSNMMEQGIVSYETEMSQFAVDMGIAYTF
ncbi:MAG: aromatic hydrocarbon degradation protein [Deltaproteobacteria bacterium HGW-Deltaproteobacteria-13]|nr:MAG: aromatic hydrocarbon degradation protein [Deltaproteobacteria bacterium HGW-Deltaproteobacteria-13]